MLRYDIFLAQVDANGIVVTSGLVYPANPYNLTGSLTSREQNKQANWSPDGRVMVFSSVQSNNEENDFLSREPGLRPTRRDCLRCHRAEGVLPARFADDAPMQFACGECHKPHARPPAHEHVACDACHAGMARAGLHGWKGHGGACATCHRAHTWRAARADCLRCHPRSGGSPCGHALAEDRDYAGCHGFRGAPKPLGPKPPGPRT